MLEPYSLFSNLLLRMKAMLLEMQQKKNQTRRKTRMKSLAACDSNRREKTAPLCGSLIQAKEGASLKLLVQFLF